MSCSSISRKVVYSRCKNSRRYVVRTKEGGTIVLSTGLEKPGRMFRLLRELLYKRGGS